MTRLATVINKIIDLINTKQSTLVSGENIKKLNGTDIVGSGNIPVKTVGGESILGDGNVGVKTINGETMIGSGDAEIVGTGTLSTTAQNIIGAINELDTDKAEQSDLTALTGRVGTAETDIVALDGRVTQAEAAVGTPLVASTVAGMTDITKIYVYTGSETGYTSGNWYYWNGTAWTSGGVYNSTAFQTDTTLAVSGMAADAKVVGDELTDVKSALSNKISKEGISEVTPQNLQIMDVEWYPNLIDETKITDGKYIQKNGTEVSGNYQVTDFIPVEAGGKYYATTYYGNNRYDMNIRFLACYDSDKAIMSSAGSDTAISSFPYTVPSGVSYVRLSFSNQGYTKPQFEKGTTSTLYHAYGVKNADLNPEYLEQFELVEGQNILNKNDSDFKSGKFLSTNGSLSDNAGYNTSGYIPVNAGDRLIGMYKSGNSSGAMSFRTVACYSYDKTAQSAKGVYSVDEFIVPDGIFYVRICYYYTSYGDYVQVQKSNENWFRPYQPYEPPHYELKEDFMFPLPSAPKHVFLPNDIYVAVGRTIELYNEQIVIDHEKYHFRWVCGKGNAYKRKFSITGDTVGNSNLVLYLLDDDKNICWVGKSTIHIVAASNPTKYILPIGDSLTNWKAWLQETMLLSSNNITWVGTRYSGQSEDSEGNIYPSGTIHHEGRSGWGADAYLADSEYTFDDRYDGVAGVDGKDNPFWDGSKFSLSHYLTTQTGVHTPDAVQIFLGTNDISSGDIDTAVDNIVAMVNSIRTEYSTMPIFVCNTIYRSNQNGYGSTGNDAYSGGNGANAWQYDQDSRVMELMQGLYNELKSDSLVYFVPLASCMDREYDFGAVQTKVNPRSDIEIPMPVESVHPQASGYYQMADVMYSMFCGILS